MDLNVSASEEPSAPGDGSDPFVPEGPMPGVVIPDHRLLRCIGKGSYGSVWLAQNMMGMYRAVKIVHRQSFEHHRPFERELSGILKFEPISRSHEGFVDVLHVGIRDNDFLYYVMELGDDEVTGQTIVPKDYSPKTLSRAISSNGKLSFEQCLRLGLALSEALGELHKHGLVHRDIKPSNILYIAGTPKLADIGLVASASEARSYVGTEGFIPPEGPGTPAGDVFSLGKVLYEASTGKDRHEFPELPTALYEIPEREKFLELNEIILRACHSDPRQRYQSAAEMHSDLVVLSNGQSVKRLRLLEHRMAWLKRAAGVASLFLITGTVILLLVYHAYTDARRRQIAAYVELGTRNIQSGDFLGALPYFVEAARMDPDKLSQTDDRLRFGSALAQCPKLVQMWSGPKQMQWADFDVTGERVVNQEYEGIAQVFDIKSGQPVSARIGGDEQLVSTALSPDGKSIATCALEPKVEIWTLDGTKMRTLEHSNGVEAVVFSGDGKQLAACCRDNSIWVWDIENGTHRLTLLGHGKGLTYNGALAAGFSHDGKLIATGGRDCTARIWDSATGRQIGPPLIHQSWVNCVGFSPDDRQLVTGSFDHKAHIWDLEFKREILPPLLHTDGVKSSKFSPDGRFIVTATLDRMVRIWIASDHRLADVNPILKHADRLYGASISPNGHQIATACFDGTVRVWDLVGGQPESFPGNCIFSGDGSRFINTADPEPTVFDTVTKQPASAKWDFGFEPREFRLNYDGGTVIAATLSERTNSSCCFLRAIETKTGQPIGPLLSVPGLSGYQPSADGNRVVTFSLKGLQAWDTETGRPVSPLLPLSQFAASNNLSVRISPDNMRMLTWNQNHVQLIDLASGKEVFPRLTFSTLVQSAEFDSIGSRFVVACSDNTLARCDARIYEANTGRQIGATLQHSDGVLCAKFSPDGTLVATASEDYTAIVWDARTGRQLIPALRHVNQISGIAFSPDSRWVATASKDKSVRVWNVQTGNPLTPPLLYSQIPNSIQFLPDSRHLLVREINAQTWLWTLPVDERPISDLKKLADVLSNGAVVFGLDSPTNSVANLREQWLELRRAYPEQFFVSPNEVARWEDYEAARAEADLDWFAARIHLERLLAVRPGDESVAARLRHVREELAVKSVANQK